MLYSFFKDMFGLNKKIFVWGLYDFANSVIVANLTLYFSLWMVIDNNLADIWYSIIIAVSTLVLILTAPLVGFYVDKSGWRMKLITPMTIAIGLLTIGIGIVGASNTERIIRILLPSIFVIAIYYLTQLSLIPYDTFLKQLSTPRTYGKISGLGKGLDDLGFILGMAVTLPFVNQKVTLFGTPGRIQAFIPAGILFLLLSLPMLVLFKDKNSIKKVRFNFRETFRSFITLLKNKNLLFFLLFFYFFSDALLTAQAFFPIYFNQVYGLNDTQKVILTAVFLLFTVIGAVFVGRVSDSIGKKRTLSTCALVLCVIFAFIPLSTSQRVVWYIYPIAGIFWGGFYAVSRAFLIYLSPTKKLGEIFSLFTMFRRFASVVGPLLWGVSIAIFASFGTVNKYRITVYPLVVMMIIGIFLLKKVEADKSERS